MINTHCLKLSLSRTNFHGLKSVRAIEVGLGLKSVRAIEVGLYHINFAVRLGFFLRKFLHEIKGIVVKLLGWLYYGAASRYKTISSSNPSFAI